MGKKTQNAIYGYIYGTSNYEQFKTLVGNRDINERQVKKIEESMTIKQLPIPIVVNEKLEVIDGQHRLEACKRNGLPVYFCVANGLDINDCVTANINSKNWNTVDIVKRYAKTGDDNCKRIVDLMGRFDADLRTVLAAAGKDTFGGTVKLNKLANGQTIFTKKDEETAADRLERANEIVDIVKVKCGQRLRLRQAIIRCCKTPGYDHRRMVKAIEKNALNYRDGMTISDILIELAGFYNYGIKRKNAYMDVYGKHNSLKIVFDAEINRFKA